MQKQKQKQKQRKKIRVIRYKERPPSAFSRQRRKRTDDERRMAGYNAQGEWSTAEPSFSEDELAHALDLRQRVTGDISIAVQLDRRDRCPHQPQCESITACVEAIAWYLRHQDAIDGQG